MKICQTLRVVGSLSRGFPFHGGTLYFRQQSVCSLLIVVVVMITVVCVCVCVCVCVFVCVCVYVCVCMYMWGAVLEGVSPEIAISFGSGCHVIVRLTIWL